MKKIISVLALTAVVAGCTTVNPYTGQTQTAKSTWGTAIGAGAGALIGSTQSSKGALIGGLAGAALGGGEDTIWMSRRQNCVRNWLQPASKSSKHPTASD